MLDLENTLAELCALTCDLTHSSRASVACRDAASQTLHIIARSSGRPRSLPWAMRIPAIGPRKCMLLVPDVTLNPHFDGHQIFEDMPNLRSIAAYWLCSHGNKEYVFSIWNPPKKFFSSPALLSSVDHIVSIMRGLLKEDSKQHARPPNLTVVEKASLPGLAESSKTASRFLIETLLTKQRLLARNGSSYLALRQWRKPIKPYQISALAALKEIPSSPCETAIAGEITKAIISVYGKTFNHIVPIPGGSSGQVESFSVRLAQCMAKALNVPCTHFLQASPTPRGASHPKKSVTLKPYATNGQIDGNVLIVDDVATSGRHIELATEAIRPHASFCTAVVWIAD